ncbi:MAG TPA: PHB depolymerase family esterase [Solirubrobacteraceae bacterium]|nr:PHB depolymerase family esterase [Solirubrobacteraceae bacterium]
MRRTVAVALAVGALLAASATHSTAGPAHAASSCQATAAPSSTVVKLTTPDGLSRQAILHLPRTHSQQPLPLLIALHGLGSSGAKYEQDTGYSTIADRDDFAVLYPSASGREWLINSLSDRDVRFISLLLDRAAELACIDARRVYATGVSNGGGMAARLGCELSDRIAAIAPIAGGYRSLPDCTPTRPVSVLEIHGTADTTVPYDGAGAQHAGAVLPYLFEWVDRDDCRAQPTKRQVAPHTVRYVWSGCRDGVSIQHLRIYGGKHGQPGAPGAEISSGGTHTISGSQQVWRFLAPLVLSPPDEPEDEGVQAGS